MDGLPERSGPWKTETMSFRDRPNEHFTIRYRNPIDAIRSIWKDPVNSPDLVFAPSRVYTDGTKDTRIYSEMWTGKWWHAIQVNLQRPYLNHLRY
jgi:hypothetical protein